MIMVRYNQPLQGAYYPQQNFNSPTCAYVQGEAAAKAYPVAPGQFVVLIDTEDPVIYTKTTDQFGRPMPIRILDYVERVENPPEQANNYVSKSDFDNFKNEIKEMLKPKQNNYKNQPAKEDKQ
jgi:hypothetical protein